jgi:plastocyanin
VSTRILAGLGSVLVLGLGVACGSSGGATTAPRASTPVATSAASAPAATSGAQACTTDATEGEVVAIADFKYDPAELSVPAGTTVSWMNEDGAPHTVTFDDGPDCGRLSQGDSTALTFDTPGEYSYFCALHPNMRASVTVE